MKQNMINQRFTLDAELGVWKLWKKTPYHVFDGLSSKLINKCLVYLREAGLFLLQALLSKLESFLCFFNSLLFWFHHLQNTQTSRELGLCSKLSSGCSKIPFTTSDQESSISNVVSLPITWITIKGQSLQQNASCMTQAQAKSID